jgi:hypothetical protein
MMIESESVAQWKSTILFVCHHIWKPDNQRISMKFKKGKFIFSFLLKNSLKENTAD